MRRLPWLRRSLVAVTSLLGFAMAGIGAFSPQVVPLENQAAEYRADVAKTIVELQQFRQMNSIPIRSREDKEGVATLINLNPATNVGTPQTGMEGRRPGRPIILRTLAQAPAGSSWMRAIPRLCGSRRGEIVMRVTCLDPFWSQARSSG